MPLKEVHGPDIMVGGLDHIEELTHRDILDLEVGLEACTEEGVHELLIRALLEVQAGKELEESG